VESTLTHGTAVGAGAKGRIYEAFQRAGRHQSLGLDLVHVTVNRFSQRQAILDSDAARGHGALPWLVSHEPPVRAKSLGPLKTTKMGLLIRL